jgi:ankyrin repeat protein
MVVEKAARPEHAPHSPIRRLLNLEGKRGANITAVDRWGRTALIWAVKKRQQAVVEMLLEIWADIEAKARHNLTALRIAAFMGCESVVQQLLERGADVEAVTQWCGAEDGEEYENGAVDTAEKSLSDLLRQWFLSKEPSLLLGQTHDMA